jgi:RNA polymerase sigma factor (TIGR02999 family)
MPDSASQVTQLLAAWRNGDPEAPRKLMPLVYDRLRRIARQHLARERVGHTVEATALVNEAFLQVVRQEDAQWKDRLQFFAFSAQVMRRLLVAYARRRSRIKRGGGKQDRVSISQGDVAAPDKGIDVLALHEALHRLASFDPRKGQLVELRFFAGMNVQETAEVLGIAPITVKREWSKARAWLYNELRTEGGE